MSPDQFLTYFLPNATWLVLGAIVGLVGSAVCGVLLLKGRPVPVALAALGPALPLLAAVLVATIALHAGPGAGLDEQAERLATAVGARLLLLLFTFPAASVLVILTAVAGVWRAPRQWELPLLALVLVAGVSAVPLATGASEEDMPFAVLRAAIYAVTGLLVAAGWVSRGTRGSEPEAAAAGALVLPAVVAAGEAGSRALNELYLLFMLPERASAARAEIIDKVLTDAVDPWVTSGWITLTVASVIGVAGVVLALRSRRTAAVALALALLVPPCLALGLGVPTRADYVALGEALPHVDLPPAGQDPDGG